MIELSQAETQRLLAKFDLGHKPIPRMNSIQATATKIKSFWGEGLVLSNEMLHALWRKIRLQRSEAVLTRLEMLALGRVVFTEVAQGLYPLCQERPSLEAALDLLSKQSDPQVDQTFTKLYFRHFPDPEYTSYDAYKMVKEWARNHPVSPQPIKLAFYSAFGPHQVAELIRGDETVAEGVARLTRGLADADAAFTHFTWVEAIPQYRVKMQVASANIQTFLTFIDHLKAEVLVDGNFRSPKHLLPFTQALLGHFIEHPSEAPETAVQHEILNFFESFLGDRKDSANALRWQPIRRVVDDLFDHWAVGRKLNNIFSFTLKIIEQTGRRDSTRHWEDRRPFWMAYWRAGRIKSCRLYAPTKKITDYRSRFRTDFPDVVDDLGTLSGRPNTNIMLMMELDNNLVVTEFSDNGKLRIGAKNQYINTSKANVEWLKVMSYANREIPHTPLWKTTADTAICILSGLRPPR